MKEYKNKRIWIVGPGLSMGGIERASSTIANSLSKAGFEVSYIAIFKRSRFFRLNDNVDLYEPENFNIKRLSIIKTIFWLRKRVSAVSPDVIIVFNYFLGALVRIAFVDQKIPLYVSDRASPQYKWSWKDRLFFKTVYKLIPPTGIIAQTEIAATKKRDEFGDKVKIRIIPNAVRNVELYAEIERKKQIVAVGRLNDYLKGFDRLIDAYALLGDTDWRLVFAGGDGVNEGAILADRIAGYGLNERVSFLGKVEDIDKVFAESSIFVIPSRSEGFPNALCEAMASGLACVSFDFIAGPRDIIDENVNGLIVEDGNVNMLAESINRLITNKNLRIRLGANAMSIRERLNTEYIAKKYIDFILHE